MELGRRLFNDRRLSRDGTVSCASCHAPDRAFSDGRPVRWACSGARPPQLPGAGQPGYGRAFFWDGRDASLEELVLQPIQDPNEMDLTLGEASCRVGLPGLRSRTPWPATSDRYSPATRRSTASSMATARRCRRSSSVACRCSAARATAPVATSGPTFTDERLHNTGVAWRDGRLADQRRAGRGDFKTPTLREIVRTAPYMHDGSLTTLEDVVEHYNRGGHANPFLDVEMRPLGLTETEKLELIAFLGALSGTLTR